MILCFLLIVSPLPSLATPSPPSLVKCNTRNKSKRHEQRQGQSRRRDVSRRSRSFHLLRFDLCLKSGFGSFGSFACFGICRGGRRNSTFCNGGDCGSNTSTLRFYLRRKNGTISCRKATRQTLSCHGSAFACNGFIRKSVIWIAHYLSIAADKAWRVPLTGTLRCCQSNSDDCCPK